MAALTEIAYLKAELARASKAEDRLLASAEEIAEQTQWIEIKEGCEMPKDFEDVHIVDHEGNRAIAWQESDDPNWYHTFGDDMVINRVAYWQRFPAAPPVANAATTEELAEGKR